jgi:hypothetical protein
VILTCGGYLVTSSILILLNKFLLSKDEFAFPLMLSGSGMAMTLLGSSVLVKFPGIVAAKQVCFLIALTAYSCASSAFPPINYFGRCVHGSTLASECTKSSY